jgi:hypothetical protein
MELSGKPDVSVCEHFGGAVRIIACIEDKPTTNSMK